MSEFNEKVIAAQAALKAPKSQRNQFGGYNYRSCEDILEAAKPILAELGLRLTLSDEIVMVGERTYVRARAYLTDGSASIDTTAYAREEEAKKGMDAAQITGSASSYARKYALNGLLLIDDTKDPDATNTHGKNPQPKVEGKPRAKVEGSGETAGKAKDFSELSALAGRYATATGMSVADAKKSLMHTYGDPRGMPEAKYRAVLLAIESNVKALEGRNG